MKYFSLLYFILLFASCYDKQETNDILKKCYKLKAITQTKHPVQPGEWRETYTEIHEPLKYYINKQPPHTTAKRSKLYIVQLGAFDQKGEQIFTDTKTYLSVFYQIPVEELKSIKIIDIPKSYIRYNTFGPQLKTSIILDSLLPSLMPDSAFALIAFSLYDLYPADNWNFVFGQASLERCIGVWSLARLGNYNLNDSLYAQCRQRTFNVAVHETGHIFGIKHCIQNECCMNGSISLKESDGQPAWLCWECLAKVCVNRNVNPLTQITHLLSFHKRVTHDERQINFYRKAQALLKQ